MANDYGCLQPSKEQQDLPLNSYLYLNLPIRHYQTKCFCSDNVISKDRAYCRLVHICTYIVLFSRFEYSKLDV